MKKIKDAKGKCAVEGCKNIRRYGSTVNYKVYRHRLCEKHHRAKNPRANNEKCWRWRGHFLKCEVCSWEGPCDGHRRDKHGRYTKENTMSICPNCHRLWHLGAIEYNMKTRDGYKIHKERLTEVKTKRGHTLKWFNK